MVILDSNQLTIKINDRSLLHVFYPLEQESLAVILLEANICSQSCLKLQNSVWIRKHVSFMAASFRCIDFQR